MKFSADDIHVLNDIFFFPKKTGFHISCKLSSVKTVCMKCQTWFSWKNKKYQFVFCWIYPEAGKGESDIQNCSRLFTWNVKPNFLGKISAAVVIDTITLCMLGNFTCLFLSSVDFLSSPEQKLRVSYCDHPLSVVHRRSSSTISLLTL